MNRLGGNVARGALLGAAVLFATVVAAMPEGSPPAGNPLADSSVVPSEWAMYNKDYSGQRYSELKDVTPQNVANLKEVCRAQVVPVGSFQSGLVVIDGVIYLTAGRRTMALGARDCSVRWTHDYKPDQGEAVPTNRGVAVMNGRVFRGTGDGRVIALDAANGAMIWKDVIGNTALGESITGAPLAWNGLVIVGLAGGDLGIRGRILGLDAATGREVWRFNTIPVGNEPGAETWKIPADLKHGGGGGGTWSSFALDPSTAELFVPVGNPEPAYGPAYRQGDNLYTNSMLVLDARTGALRWWYQLSPNDGRDYDLAAAPILYFDSQQRSVVAFAGKNGYVHAVDRKTHQLLFRTPITTIKNQDKAPTPEGVDYCPGIVGGAEWNGPAFDGPRKVLYVGAIDWCNVIKTEVPQYRVGDVNWGGNWTFDSEKTGWITAVDSESGAVKWRYDAGMPVVAGVTPTAGGVLFAGTTGGDFLVLDSANGNVLRKIATGGGLAGGIVTYELDSRQYVAFESGNVSRSVIGTVGAPTLVLMRLDLPGQAGSARSGMAGSAATPAAVASRGKNLYDSVCSSCHGPQGTGIPGHSLQDLKARLSLEQTMDKIKRPNPPMPKLYPAQLSAGDVKALAVYLQAGIAGN